MTPRVDGVYDFLLHVTQRGERSGVESILSREAPVGLLGDREGFGACAVGESETTAVTPLDVMGAKRFELVKDL
jgi:hypothetical protein